MCLVYAALAQSVEQLAVNQWVVGSSPTSSAICSISLEVKHSLAKQESPVRVWYVAPIIRRKGVKLLWH